MSCRYTDAGQYAQEDDNLKTGCRREGDERQANTTPINRTLGAFSASNAGMMNRGIVKASKLPTNSQGIFSISWGNSR